MFIRILGASFLDKFFESVINALLATEYALGAFIFSRPAIDEIIVIEPSFAIFLEILLVDIKHY